MSDFGASVNVTNEVDELEVPGTCGNNLSSRPAARVRVVRDAVDAAEVARLRQLACAGSDWFDPDADLRRDAAGIVWLLERFDKPVASARALPFASGVTFLGEANGPLHLLPVDDSWVELGRLVAEPSVAGFMAAQFLFAECASWLLEYTTYRHGYAVCETRMIPYYRRFGMQVSPEIHQMTYQGKPECWHIMHCDFAEIDRDGGGQTLADL
jgi:hypothetical protein